MTSFENGFGLWGEGVKRKWSLQSANVVASLLDAPTFDHTIRSRLGHYLFAKDFYRSGNTVPIIAEIDSPPITPNAFCQLRFYMFANSENVRLQVISLNLQTNERRQLEEIVNSDYQFSYHFINIPPSVSPSGFKIILTASFRVNLNMYSDPWIAIDDISLSNQCTIKQSTPTSNGTTLKPDNSCPTIACTGVKSTALVCLKPSQMCDFIKDCQVSFAIIKRNY